MSRSVKCIAWLFVAGAFASSCSGSEDQLRTQQAAALHRTCVSFVRRERSADLATVREALRLPDVAFRIVPNDPIANSAVELLEASCPQARER